MSTAAPPRTTTVSAKSVQIAPLGSDPNDANAWTDIGHIAEDVEFFTDPDLAPDPDRVLQVPAKSVTWSFDLSREQLEDLLAVIGVDEEEPYSPTEPQYVGPEPVTLDETHLANVHPPALCAGQGCVVHHPSPHHMNTWPVHWRNDRGMAERTCPHGIGHPDPDDLAYARFAADRAITFADVLLGLDDALRGNAEARAVHGCDGCCAETAREFPPVLPEREIPGFAR